MKHSRNVITSDGLVALVVASFAISFGALWAQSPIWAVTLIALPATLVALRFRGYRRLRDLELSTVKAVARVPEALGVLPPGHATNTAELAARMGRQSGLAACELRELVWAASFHEIGRVRLAGDQSDRAFSRGQIALWSAAIVQSVESVNRAALVIRDAAEPFRAPGCDPDPAIDSRAQIVAVACRFQHLVDSGATANQAIDELRREATFRYSPEAVELVRATAAGVDDRE